MDKKKKPNTEVVLVSGGPIDALGILKQELSNLKAITETQYKTTGNIDGFPTNLQSEIKIDVLIKMFSSVMGRSEAYNKAQTELEIKNAPVFKISDSKVEDFKHDIQLRIAVIEHADRKKELEDLIKEGETFLTKADQYEIYKQKLEAFIKK